MHRENMKLIYRSILLIMRNISDKS